MLSLYPSALINQQFPFKPLTEYFCDSFSRYFEIPWKLNVLKCLPGKSKRASALVAAVEKATDNFIERGEQIAYENPDITQEMLSAVDEVRKTGAAMSIAAREFSEDPCSSLKRGNMVRAARNLLSSVTRLLILADMVDVHLLLKSLHVVEDDLDKLRDASSQEELLSNMRVSLVTNI